MLFRSTADSSFNELLLIGFLTGMKKEWAWRVGRGESTRNLAAFEKVLSGDDNEFLGTFGEADSEPPAVEADQESDGAGPASEGAGKADEADGQASEAPGSVDEAAGQDASRDSADDQRPGPRS